MAIASASLTEISSGENVPGAANSFSLRLPIQFHEPGRGSKLFDDRRMRVLAAPGAPPQFVRQLTTAFRLGVCKTYWADFVICRLEEVANLLIIEAGGIGNQTQGGVAVLPCPLLDPLQQPEHNQPQPEPEKAQRDLSPTKAQPNNRDEPESSRG